MKNIVNRFLLLMILFFIPINVSAQNYFKLGKKELKNGKYSIAVSYFTKHLKSSEDYKAYINRGIAYSMMNQIELALNDYNKSIQLKPKSENSYYNRGIAYSKSGKLEEAIKDFQKVIELKPNYARAFDKIGKIYFEQNKLEDAKKIYSNLIRIDPKSSDAFLNKGIANLRLHDYENAIEDFENAKKLGTSAIEELTPQFYAAITYIILRDESIYDFSMGVKNSSKFNITNKQIERILRYPEYSGSIKGSKQERSELYKIIGFAWYMFDWIHDREIMKDFLNQSIDINPTDPLTYLYRGIVFNSVNDFEKAIQLKPDLAIAYFLLGNINFVEKKYEIALSNYLIALQNNLNKDGGLFYEWILSYRYLIDQSVGKKFSIDNFFHNIATAYQLTGNDSEAEIYFNKQKETDNQIVEYKTQRNKQYSQYEENEKLALAEEEYHAFMIKKDQLSHFEAYEFMESFISSYLGSPYLKEIESYFIDLKKKLNERAAFIEEGEEYDLVFLYESGFVIPRLKSIKNLIDKELSVIVKPGTALKNAKGKFSDKVVTSEDKYQLPASGTLKVYLTYEYLFSNFPKNYETDEAYYGVYAVSDDLYSFIQAYHSKVVETGIPDPNVVQIGILAITEHASRSHVRDIMTYRKKTLFSTQSLGANFYNYYTYTDMTVSENEINEAKRILDSLGIKNYIQ